MAPHRLKPGSSRINWIDFSKGICIMLVVLLHATNGVEKIYGYDSWLHNFVAWARPFRMPDFFLIAGLFLARRIDLPWRQYLDTKVVHFAYFYILWMSVWYVLKLPEFAAQSDITQALWRYPLSFIQPLGTLWFIYMLAVFFVVAKFLRNTPVWLVFGIAALLHGLHIHTGARIIDEFAARFVFFYAGYIFADIVFASADAINRQKTATIINGLSIWAVVNGWLVFGGWAQTPGIELVLGFAGTGAVIAVGVLLAKSNFGKIFAYCGRNSIIIFLSYFIFMAASRIVLLKLNLQIDPGFLALIITAAGIFGPLTLHLLIKNTALEFIYQRPAAFTLQQAPGGQSRSTPLVQDNKTVDELDSAILGTGKST